MMDRRLQVSTSEMPVYVPPPPAPVPASTSVDPWLEPLITFVNNPLTLPPTSARLYQEGEKRKEEGHGAWAWIGGLGAMGLVAMVSFAAMRTVAWRSTRTIQRYTEYASADDFEEAPDVETEGCIE